MRLLLGMGRGRFPAATRAVAEWFPVKERSTAMGIINAGTAIGMIVAPPLIALVLSFANWRWIFFVTGAVGCSGPSGGAASISRRSSIRA
jgi:ACS family hexuronate transporter-like MFS transporter